MSRLTPAELRELWRLHLQLGRRVGTSLTGDYRSAVRGRGMEFEEVRGYVPGDDIRHIDWNTTARTGDPFIKVFREERQLTVVVAVDVSGSMGVGSGGRDQRTDKRLQTARIAGGVTWAGLVNRDRVGLLLFSDQVEAYLPPRRTRGHAWTVIRKVFETVGSEPGTDIAAAVSFLSRTQRRKAVIVLVSDFLDDSAWERPLGALARRHEVHAIVVHDPIERGLGELGLVEAFDAESGRVRVIDSRSFPGEEDPAERVVALSRTGCRAVAVSTAEDAYAALHRHFQRSRRR